MQSKSIPPIAMFQSSDGKTSLERRPRAEADDDFAKSLLVAYQAIKDRVAEGGPPWIPKVRDDGG